MFDHLCRQIHAADRNSAFVQISRNLPRPASEITDNAVAADTVGEPVEQAAVQRFILQLVVDATCALIRNPVIARLHVDDLFLRHYSPPAPTFFPCTPLLLPA